jgi:hypothetical protein
MRAYSELSECAGGSWGSMWIRVRIWYKGIDFLGGRLDMLGGTIVYGIVASAIVSVTLVFAIGYTWYALCQINRAMLPW